MNVDHFLSIAFDDNHTRKQLQQYLMTLYWKIFGFYKINHDTEIGGI